MVLAIPSSAIPLNPYFLALPDAVFTPVKPIQRTLRVLVWVHALLVLLFLLTPYPFYAFTHAIPAFYGFVAVKGGMPIQYAIYGSLTAISCGHAAYFSFSSFALRGYRYGPSLRVLEDLTEHFADKESAPAAHLANMLEAQSDKTPKPAATSTDTGESPPKLVLINITPEKPAYHAASADGDALAVRRKEILGDILSLFLSIRPSQWRVYLEAVTLVAAVIVSAAETFLAANATLKILRLSSENFSDAINRMCDDGADESTPLHSGQVEVSTPYSGQGFRMAALIEDSQSQQRLRQSGNRNDEGEQQAPSI